MNKKLIAAAVVAGLAAPMAAQADVNVYGIAQLELTHNDTNGTTKTTLNDDRGQTRFGIRWSEDLGGGMKALGEFEFAPNMINAANGQSNSSAAGPYARQTWLGLKGAFGEVQFGTILQPYKYSGGVKYDAFAATNAEARKNDGGMMGASGFGQGGYLANAIAYKNRFGMANVWLAYVPSEYNDAANKYPGSKGDLEASVVVDFSNGQAGFAYSKDAHQSNATIAKAATTAPAGVRNAKIFGKYSFGTSTVLAQYESSKSKDPNSTTTKYLFVGYQLKMPAMNKLVVQLGQEKPDSGNKTNYAALGVIHNMSKKTSMFAAYRTTKQDGGQDVKVLTVGLKEKF
jgi:predicted porin